MVVTGASSGIGSELARTLAARGHGLALVARRRERLDDLAQELSGGYGVDVSVHARDLINLIERRELVAEVRAMRRPVVGLCNNAGFGTSGRFHELDADRELDEVELNVSAVVDLTHSFVGEMVERGAGAILNTASIAAFQPLPGLATYSATKAFVQTFSEALHTELTDTGVSCTVLCPGPVATEWEEISGAGGIMPSVAYVDPESIAESAVDGMERGKRTVMPGLLPRAAAASGRFVPRTVLLPAIRAIVGRRKGAR